MPMMAGQRLASCFGGSVVCLTQHNNELLSLFVLYFPATKRSRMTGANPTTQGQQQPFQQCSGYCNRTADIATTQQPNNARIGFDKTTATLSRTKGQQPTQRGNYSSQDAEVSICEVNARLTMCIE